ncbi:recombinase family protein [Methylobacterium sp. 37f]|uniref:recombinase family protein n=1 Tax=Methylobacterium sp. 37f TaxID=2817058 RepID=UPI001FFDBAEE|nr:recombinase family protein [Methylobacterium sp. 37f]MCK2053801.1 recombinase family protein [Methylobacterium sp. 37f]
MSHGRFVSYVRCSTDRQGKSGLGLDAQREAIRIHLAGRTPISEVVEVESGTRSDRPKLQEALGLCRLHRATLVIAKLDRLARNVHFVSSLMESGVDFVAVDFPTANRLTIHILAAVAEHEAKMISDRTKAALARKKVWYETRTAEELAELQAQGRPTRLGGNRGGLEGVGHLGRAASASVRGAKADRRAADLAPMIRGLLASGMSKRAVARELMRREIPTPQGKAVWHGPQIAAVLDRGVA